MNYALIAAQTASRIRALIARKKSHYSNVEAPKIRFRINIRPNTGEHLIINHSFFVYAVNKKQAILHPRVQATCEALAKLGYDSNINIVEFPEQPFLDDLESSTPISK